MDCRIDDISTVVVLLVVVVVVVIVHASGYCPWGVNPSVYQSISVYRFQVATCSTFAHYSPGALVQLIKTFCEGFPVDVGDCLLVEYFTVVSVYAGDNVVKVPCPMEEVFICFCKSSSLFQIHLCYFA